MLSYRILPVNIPMVPLVQLQHLYCTSSDRRVKILRLRKDQKQLFGGVIQNDSKTINNRLNTDQNAGASQNEMKVSTGNRASEFHWLVTNGQSKKSFITINGNRAAESKGASLDNASGHWITQSQNKTNTWSEPMQTQRTSTTTNTKGAVISAKTLLQSFVTKKSRTTKPTQFAAQEIPFDADELNSIVKYPMVTGKCSLSQTISLTDKAMQIPSISKVLTATMPEGTRIALKKWKMAKIAELGTDGFKQYQEETFSLGKEFHSAIEQYLSNGEAPASDSSINQLWQSVNPSLNELKPKAVLLEQPILHADLKYKGIIDNVSMVKDELCAFEWKTSEKAKPRLTSTYDAPVQLCAYLGALNADPRYDLIVKNGRVVVAYKNGDLANVFDLSETDLRKYWLMWLQRLQEYWIRVKDGTLPDPI